MMWAPVWHCMTNSIRNSAWLALVCIAFRLSCLSAADPRILAVPQAAATSRSVDNSKHGAVSILVEYACKTGAHHKAERVGLESEVMQRGADDQPTRVLAAKNVKTGDMVFMHVLESDCSGEQAIDVPGAASLALVHKVSGEEYFYAISAQGECLRAFRIRSLGQFDPIDMSTKLQDCQNEVRIWSAQAAKWKAQANHAANPRP